MSDESRTSGQDGWISEDEAHRLLARAVELDAENRSAVSVRDLLQAAEEAGIPRMAFQRALVELRAGELEPVTVGQRLSMRLLGFRRAAVVASFVAAAGITPGDSIVLSVGGGLGLYGAYEGAIALARLLGRSATPRVPPGVGRAGPSAPVKGDRILPDEGSAVRFVVLARRCLGRPDHSPA